MKSQKKWVKLVLVLAILYIVCSGNRGLWSLYKLHQEKQNLKEQVTLLRSEIGLCQAEYQTFEKNPAVLEKQAREELNLVKTNEIVYKFTETGRN